MPDAVLEPLPSAHASLHARPTGTVQARRRRATLATPPVNRAPLYGHFGSMLLLKTYRRLLRSEAQSAPQAVPAPGRSSRKFAADRNTSNGYRLFAVGLAIGLPARISTRLGYLASALELLVGLDRFSFGTGKQRLEPRIVDAL